MGQAPSTTTGGAFGVCYPVGANFRVVRIARQVEEFYSTAATPALALADAKAQQPNAWRKRTVIQSGAQDEFEYDVVSSDVATVDTGAAR